MMSTEKTAPGLAETQGQVQAGLAASKSVAAAQQVDAGRFIRENGHQVVSGHADVGSGSFDRGRQA
jgi:hypothetical protein